MIELPKNCLAAAMDKEIGEEPSGSSMNEHVCPGSTSGSSSADIHLVKNLCLTHILNQGKKQVIGHQQTVTAALRFS